MFGCDTVEKSRNLSAASTPSTSLPAAEANELWPNKSFLTPGLN